MSGIVQWVGVLDTAHSDSFQEHLGVLCKPVETWHTLVNGWCLGIYDFWVIFHPSDIEQYKMM